MFKAICFALLVFCTATSSRVDAHGSHDDGIVEAYQAFVAAQNARDIKTIRSHLTARPDFLWVSDGRPHWGRETMLARMANFQKAEIWHVTPYLDNATVVDLGPRAAMLHFSLVLRIGRSSAPNDLGFLVSALFRREDNHWRIAALLTTRDKTRR